MPQEENAFGCNYSCSGGGGGGGGGRGGSSSGGGGGSCRSKKIKPKKVPQRGLGVAQLEKIRIEEEQKTQESLHIEATSFLGVQKIRPNNMISPFHNSPPSSSPPNALFRHSQSTPNIEILQESSCSFSKGGGESIGCTREYWGGGEYNLVQDHHSFTFDPELGNLPPPPPPPHYFQPPHSSMAQAKSSFGISPSSVLTSHLEPPSNQNPRHNAYASHFTEEDKMVGMKRSYPFSLETLPPPPSLQCGFRPSFAPSSSRHDVLACSGGNTPTVESRNKFMRGSPVFERLPNESIDDERLNGEFLTLAPPSFSSPPSNCSHNHPIQPESSGSLKESFNFFPITNQRSNDLRNRNGDEGGDMIDLNLKL